MVKRILARGENRSEGWTQQRGTRFLGFLESRLAACYSKKKKPNLAVLHFHRSIRQNPIHFQSHIQQAMVYKSLGNYCMAVRSAMIADYVHWLCGNSNPARSNSIKLHWQTMMEEAVRRLTDFSVVYTPCSGKPTKKQIQEAEQVLKKLSPSFSAYIYTDTDGGHLFPYTTDWSKSSVTSYFLTLGFKSEQDGILLNNLLHRNSHMSTGPQDPFMLLSPDSPENMCETFEKKILPLLEFINCNKLAAGFSTGSGVIERLQYADCLYQLGRKQEHEQVLEQTLAELAVAPYLQDISPPDAKLLKRLTADTMDTLAGKNTNQKCVLNEVKQQVGSADTMGTKMMSPSSKPLKTNSEETSQQKFVPEVRPLCSWEPHPKPKQPMFIYPHMMNKHSHTQQPHPLPTHPQQPHPQQTTFTQTHSQQITFTQPQTQQTILTQPHSQQITFTQLQPQQTTFTQPQPQQTILTQPHSQQITFTQPQPQQTTCTQPHSQKFSFKQLHARKCTFTQPYPQKTKFKQPHLEQPMVTYPHSQLSHSQQPGYRHRHPKLVKFVQLCK
ncbi:Spermatogenesis-associated protein 16 [Bagarius yarrelli]|uniref:Spermatogenesis-associated protein 16 n=1 Tax=Bagarius yarrelli TaxID=175774 RepID=A0A556TRV7_BAGYA|nr:Spermatogenesis-associated protein 16 [Bagarius yarrelli]